MDNRTDNPLTSSLPEQEKERSSIPEGENRDINTPGASDASSAGTYPPAFNSTPPPPPPTENSNPPHSANSNTPDDGGKKSLGVMIGALLVLMVVFLGLIFYFVLRQPQEPEQPVEQMPIENTLPSPTEVPLSPTPELTEEAVEEIEIGSPEADLSPIETDLEQL